MLFPILLAGAALAASQASIETPTSDDSEIVVTGKRAPPHAVVRSTLKSIAHPANIGGGDFQMARWLDPVCPVALTSDALEAQAVEEAIRAIAKQVGAPVGGRDCDRNIEIVATNNLHAALLDVNAREPNFLRGISKRDAANLIDGEAPIRWGSVTKTYNSDGAPARSDGSVHSSNPSLIEAGTETGLGRMIIVVDLDQVHDVSSESAHAYIAMIALAQINPDGIPRGVDTILSKLSFNQQDGGLKRFDLAYLKSLYSVKPSLHGPSQQSDMTRKIVALVK